MYLHFNTLDSHTPRIGWLVQVGLDGVADCLALGENLAQAPGSQDVTESGLCQQSCRVTGIFHIGDRHRRIVDLVVNYGIHSYRHTVFRQNLNVKVSMLKYCYKSMTNCNATSGCMPVCQLLKIKEILTLAS